MNTQEFERLLAEAIYNQVLVWDQEHISEFPEPEDAPPTRTLSETPNWNWWFAGHQILTAKDAVITLIEEVGGEGAGDYIHLVFRVDRDGSTQWFKKTGYYRSYEGTDWTDGDLIEVTPQERTVIVYE